LPADKRHALRIGLTGGMGSGKSAAAREFVRLGAPVIDTDIIARELVTLGQPALVEIVTLFGPEVLDGNGNLDRTRLRKTVFSDPVLRKRLEAILHPRIRKRALALAQQAREPYCILVIPLLAESTEGYPLERTLVIDTPRELQLKRVAARDGLAESEIEAILATQASRAQRLAIADDIIVNDRSPEHLRNEIERLHHRYSKISRNLKA